MANSSVFLPCHGGVARVAECSSPSGVSVLAIEGIQSPIAITEFALDLHTNHQFLHALDEKIYLFPFGDRIGELTVTGVSFSSGYCQESGDVDGKTSVGKPLSWYLKERVSGQNGLKPKKITIAGQQPLLGFVTGFRMMQQRADLPVVQWVMRFSVVLDTTGGAGTPAAGGGGAGNTAASTPGFGGGEFRGPGGGIRN